MSVIIENTIVCKLENLPTIKHKLRDYVGHSLVEHYKDKEHALISFDTRGDIDFFADGPLLSSDEYLIKETMNEEGDLSTIYGDTEIGQRISFFIKEGLIFPKISEKKKKQLISNIKYWCEA